MQRLSQLLTHFSRHHSLSHTRPAKFYSTMSKPDVTLYTFGTPNGVPISILLEELKALYNGPEYEYVFAFLRQDLAITSP